jgi:bifunctional oligoribonuclease and PAP phosphatase NrnA
MALDEIITEIKSCNNIGISFHVSPDGDSIGSSLALLIGLRSLNKNAYILSKEKLPEDLSFLSFSNEIDGMHDKLEEGTDCVIIIDCGDVKRINAQIAIEKRNYKLLNVDHHMTNEMFGDFNFVDVKAAAAAEIIYEILIKLRIVISKSIAECLYTSILTDTGSFKHPSTSASTHMIAAKLISTGINFSSIHRKLFENIKYQKLKLYGLVFNSMKLVDDKICVLKITKAMIEENGSDYGNTSDIISMALQLDTAEVAILLTEKSEGIKISLRSKEIVDVRKIAEKFGGGGHIRAAGGFIENKTILDAEQLIINEIKKELL